MSFAIITRFGADPSVGAGLHRGLYCPPLSPMRVYWSPLEAYRTFVGRTISQYLKSYRTNFPRLLSKSGGLMVDSTGGVHWTPVDSTLVHPSSIGVHWTKIYLDIVKYRSGATNKILHFVQLAGSSHVTLLINRSVAISGLSSLPSTTPPSPTTTAAPQPLP